MPKGQYGRKASTDAWMINTRRNIVVVLDDLDFFWDEDDLIKLARWYAGGYDLFQIAEFFKRDPDEVWAAWMHLARKDKLLVKVVK